MPNDKLNISWGKLKLISNFSQICPGNLWRGTYKINRAEYIYLRHDPVKSEQRVEKGGGFCLPEAGGFEDIRIGGDRCDRS